MTQHFQGRGIERFILTVQQAFKGGLRQVRGLLIHHEYGGCRGRPNTFSTLCGVLYEASESRHHVRHAAFAGQDNRVFGEAPTFLDGILEGLTCQDLRTVRCHFKDLLPYIETSLLKQPVQRIAPGCQAEIFDKFQREYLFGLFVAFQGFSNGPDDVAIGRVKAHRLEVEPPFLNGRHQFGNTSSFQAESTPDPDTDGEQRNNAENLHQLRIGQLPLLEKGIDHNACEALQAGLDRNIYDRFPAISVFRRDRDPEQLVGRSIHSELGDLFREFQNQAAYDVQRADEDRKGSKPQTGRQRQHTFENAPPAGEDPARQEDLNEQCNGSRRRIEKAEEAC